jgi:hypothetical protein
MLCALISNHLVTFYKPAYSTQELYEKTQLKRTNTTQLSILHQTQVQVSFNGLSRSAA